MAQFLQKNGVENVPAALQRQSAPSQLWQSPQLIISQCCGPDLFTPEGADLCVIGKPVFANLDCTAGCYYSHIISRQIEYSRTARIAVNSISSRSGHYALTEWLEAREIEVTQLGVSGSHLNSLSMLEKDVADYAALDAHLVDQFGVKIEMPVVGRSTESLAPPFVFHRHADIDNDLLYKALKHAIDRRGREVGIIDLIKCDRSDYQNPGARDVATPNTRRIQPQHYGP